PKPIAASALHNVVSSWSVRGQFRLDFERLRQLAWPAWSGRLDSVPRLETGMRPSRALEMSSANAWPPTPPIGMWTPSLANHWGWVSDRASQSDTVHWASAAPRGAVRC